MIIPYVVRLKATSVRVVGETAGNLYAVATVGSIFGTLLSGYFLIPDFGVKESFFALSVVLVVIGVISFGRKVIPILAIVLLFGLIQFTQTSPSLGRTVYESDSSYYRIQVFDIGDMRYLTTDLCLEAYVYLNSTNLAVPYYTLQHALYVGDPQVKRVLYLGLGAGAMPMDLYRNSNASMDVVEIDPEIIYVAEKFFNFSENNRIKVYNADARFFLENSDQKYDLIVVDLYGSDISMPYYLTTVETVREIKNHLTPNGTVFINVVSAVEGNSSGILKAVYKTFNTTFPNLYVFLTQANLTEPQNIVIIADQKEVVNPESYFTEKLNSTGEMMRYYNGTIDTNGYSVLTDDKNPIDNYDTPLLVYEQQQLLNWMSNNTN
jgi:spermidine synthase